MQMKLATDHTRAGSDRPGGGGVNFFFLKKKDQNF